MKGKEKEEEGKGEREGRRNKSIRHSDKESVASEASSTSPG